MFPSVRHMLAVLSGLLLSLFGVTFLTQPSVAEQVLAAPAAEPPVAAAEIAASATPTPSPTVTSSSSPRVVETTAESPSPSPSPSLAPVVVPAGASTETIRCVGEPEAAESLRTALLEGAAKNTSVAVHDHLGNAYCGYRDSVEYVSASVVKVSTVASLMRLRESQGRSLSASERKWARAAITVSDNSAQENVWRAQGTVSGLRRFIAESGLTQTTVAAGGQWGLTTTTAHDQVLLMDHIVHGELLESENRDLLLEWMRGVTEDQRWGVPTGANEPEMVAVKDGWLPYRGSWRINSIGWVKDPENDCTMAVLSTGGSSFESGIERVSAVARAVNE